MSAAATNNTQPHRCFIIAEAGVNHNGDPKLAAQLIDAAAPGSDAVKFQTFRADRLVCPGAVKTVLPVLSVLLGPKSKK